MNASATKRPPTRSALGITLTSCDLQTGPERTPLPGPCLGGLGGALLVAGGRWSGRGKGAGSGRPWNVRARPRTLPRCEQRAPAAQPVFRQVLLNRNLEWQRAGTAVTTDP